MATFGRSGRVRALALVGAVLLFATGFTHVERVSVSQSGGQAGAGGTVEALSRTGRYALLDSTSPLNQADASGTTDPGVYRRDNLTGGVVRVDLSVGAGLTGCCAEAMSANGRAVAFIVRQPNSRDRLYIRDIAAGTTTLDSVLTDGTPIDPIYVHNVRISRDGRYLAFTAGSDPYDYRVYWRDRVAGTTSVLGPTGSYANVQLSGDGLHLVAEAGCFHCPGQPLSYDLGGPTYPTQPIGGAYGWHGISDNGRYMVSRATRYDRVTGVYRSAPGPDPGSGTGTISGDGRFVAFTTENPAWLPASNTAPQHFQRLYLWDTASDQVRSLDLNATGKDPDSTYESSALLSRTGRYAAYSTLASNIVAHDTNDWGDGFVVDAAVPRPTSTSTNRPRGATNVPVVVRGGFMLRDALADFGPGITVESSEPAANGGIRFFITIAPNAARGPRDVGIANPGIFGLVSGSCNDCFRVT